MFYPFFAVQAVCIWPFFLPMQIAFVMSAGTVPSSSPSLSRARSDLRLVYSSDTARRTSKRASLSLVHSN